jgi:TolB-like protein
MASMYEFRLCTRSARLAIIAVMMTWSFANALAQTVAESTPANDPLPQEPLVVAVLPFDANDEEAQEIAGQVSDLLTAYLSAEPGVMLVERAELDKILSEIELGMSGTVDSASAAHVGRLTGAQLLITGRSIPVQRDVVVVAKIIGVETGRVIGENVTFEARASVAEAVAELATKVANKIAEQGHMLVPKPEPEEDLLARLQPLVAGRILPSVSVSIPEISLNLAVIDPAAETQLSDILLSLGFELIDPLATNRMPDVQITGEAFSEFGVRKGNLVSSKGSVEVKAIGRKAGSVLLISREVSVAVDIEPETAGKTALAKSATKLAERLVPVLAEVTVE